MSIRLPVSSHTVAEAVGSNSSSGSSETDDEETWDDWLSDVAKNQGCESLFEPKVFSTTTEALKYDRESHNFDLKEICYRLSLDVHQRIRLINFIRKTRPAAESLASLTGRESFFSEDEYLVPALEDDPLLQLEFSDCSDSDVDSDRGDAGKADASKRVRVLSKQLERVQHDFAEYRTFVAQRLNAAAGLNQASDEIPERDPKPQDNDVHYFQSYGETDIHATMIRDRVRTSSYASFILQTPSLFQDAVVMDVGCGTGILSLFAARAGAKRVIAVEASDVAEKARQIVKANEFDSIITVISGKVEDIALPDDLPHVDVIVSEWMGYALLYESMLDSVLRARDRFLRPGGVMAPSQTRMMLGLCDASEIRKERVDFWSDIYGFDLSAMAADAYDDAIVDVVEPGSMISAPCVIKDIFLSTVTPRQLDFAAPFTLTSVAVGRTKVHAFLLYFDAFFNPTGEAAPSEMKPPAHTQDTVLAEVWPVGGKAAPQRRRSSHYQEKKIVSFSTSPRSTPTHWKQTLFLLREPIPVSEGTVVSGTFHCRKGADNPRELDVEIHYSIKGSAGADTAGEVLVQIYKVR